MPGNHKLPLMRRHITLISLLMVLPFLSNCAGIRPPSRKPDVVRTLEVTGYCRCGKCCSWHRTWYGKPVYSSGPMKGKRKLIGITASGKRASRGTIAADTSRYPFGTVVNVPGYGFGRVEDRGGAIKGDRIDLFFGSHRDAERWGRRRLKTQIWLPD